MHKNNAVPTEPKTQTREQQLEQIILDISWMARRYADGRMTYAVKDYNDSLAKALSLGVYPAPDNGTVWAVDGNSGLPTDHVEKYGMDGQKIDGEITHA